MLESFANCIYELSERIRPMQIIAHCPKCGDRQRLEDDAADRRIRCPKCNRLFRIPKLEDLPKATDAIKRAKGSVYVDENGKTYG